MILLAVFGVFAACTSAAPDPVPPRLVILYAPCTLAKTFLTPYGAEPWLTPNLARFADNAVTFENHRTEAGSSGVAYAALYSGVQADRHGVFLHPTVLPDEIDLIAESFAARGYDTYFWSGHPMASRRLNYDQGVSPHRSFTHRLKASDTRFIQLLETLRSDPTRRAFVVTGFTVTHGPYRRDYLPRYLEMHPHERPESTGADLDRWVRLYRQNYLALAYNYEDTMERLGIEPAAAPQLIQAIELLYKASVAHLDQMFGELLEAVDEHGLRDESLIAFTADHGEILFRENALFKWTHSSSLAPEVLEVPLLIAAPRSGIVPGRYTGVTRSIDVFPTLLALSGLSVPANSSIEGRDLAPVLTGREAPPDLLAYSHSAVIPRVVRRQMQAGGESIWGQRMRFFPRPGVNSLWVSVRRGGKVFKFRNFGTRWGFEAYDLDVDPGETTDLFDPDDSEHQAMAQNLRRYKSKLVESARALAAARSDGSPTESEEAAALRSLGYIR